MNRAAMAFFVRLLAHPVCLLADDPRDADRARAAIVRAAVTKIAPSIVTIETVGGAQPIAEQAPASRPSESDDPQKKGGDEMPGGRRPRGPGGRPQRPQAPAFRVADGPTTGLVWSADGWIVSSSFNFVRKPTITTVILPGIDSTAGGAVSRRQYVARLVARDTIRRIALLKIDATDLPVPQWAPASEVRPGQYAITCGRGFGTWLPGPEGATKIPDLFPTIHLGIISATARRNGNAVQTDAKTSPANYGGPLVDIEGRVIGLIVPLAGAGEEMAGVEWYDGGIGFATTRASIEKSIDRLMAGVSIEAGKMGVTINDAADGRCRVAGVADPSPALRVGVKPRDIIVAFDGQPVGDRMELLRRISDRAAGETVTVTIERGDPPQTLEFKVTLARSRDIGGVQPEEDDEDSATQPASAPSSQPASEPARDQPNDK